jgi:tetratricopeptide (TPR) repeat protein
MRLSILLPLPLLFCALAATPVGASTVALAPAVAEIRQLLRDDDVDAAVDASDKAVKARASDAHAWAWAGRAYGQKAMRSGMLGAARWAGRSRSAFEKAVELDPTHVEARFDLMSFYVMAPGIMGGSRDKAEAQATAIAAQDASMGKLAQAQLAGSDKQPERIEPLLREAIALDPDNVRARTSLAAQLARSEQWDAAHAVWTAQLERDRHQAMARYQLGRLAALSGESLDAGLAHLDRFIADGEIPNDLSMPAAHWRRGQLLDKLGRHEDAIAALELALAGKSVAKLAQADLDRIRKR